MASIQRIVSKITGDISYRAQVRVKGHATQGQTFPNKKEAQQWANSIEAAIRENRYFPQARASRTLFGEVTKRYRESVLSQMSADEQYTRGQRLEWWEKRFTAKTVAEITPDVIAEARDALANEPFARAKERVNKRTGVVTAPKLYKRTGATINRYLAALSHVFTVAIKEWRLVDRNPVRDVGKKKESRGRVRFLSNDERGALLAACEKSDWKPMRALVLLAITTGARRSELVNLRWDDLDLRGDSGSPHALVRESKNGEPRVLPLVGKALEALRELKLQNSARSEYVFPNPSGFPGSFYYFDSFWYEAMKNAGISNLRFHDLRHTTASYLAQQGASLLEIADTLGHKTLAMVKRYSHLAQSHKVGVIERMARERDL